VAACLPYEDCDDDHGLEEYRESQNEREYEDYRDDPGPSDEEIAELELIVERDAWADAHLATEKATASYWRDPITWISRESRQRLGAVLQQPRLPLSPDGPRNDDIEYVCDLNYDDAQSGGCVPADRDYECWELQSWGIANIPLIGEDWMLLDDDGNGVGCEVIGTAQEAQSSLPSDARDTSLAEPAEPACSTALTRLLPTPEEMGLEWTLSSGTVTGVGCRALAEVAASFQNPAQATADLESFGWLENVFQTVDYGGDIRISIHRFGGPEGAVNALEYLSSVQGEPAGTVAMDPAQLEPNQRGLIQPGIGWAALLEQDGAYLTRVTVRVNADSPPLSQAQSVMTAIQARWSTYPEPKPYPVYYPDPETGLTMLLRPDGSVAPLDTSVTTTPVTQEVSPYVPNPGVTTGGYVPLTETSSPVEADELAAPPNEDFAAAYPCDVNYGSTASGGCVPADRDYDCSELHEMGIGDIPIIGTDWMHLDGYQDFATEQWIASPDDIGCEWAGE
jgi:hypothetical protein